MRTFIILHIYFIKNNKCPHFYPCGTPLKTYLQFETYIYYIKDWTIIITSRVLKFADDTKAFRKVKNYEDKQDLQNYLDKLVK